MRKFILLITALMLVATVSATGNGQQPEASAIEAAKDSVATTDSVAQQSLGRKIADGAVDAIDSIGVAAERVANHPVSQRIADGAVETFDSISAAGKRFGKKAKVWGDSLSVRTRRAWNGK